MKVLASAGSLYPAIGEAQLRALPFAEVEYEFNSNIFAQPSSLKSFYRSLGDATADHTVIEHAGGNFLYDWSQQEFYVNFEAQHFGYQDDKNLNHNEILARGGLKWRLMAFLSGTLDYQYDRSMVPFLDFEGTELFIQHQNLATVSANVEISPEFSLETEGKINALHSPRRGLPDLNLTEDSVRERMLYAVSTGLAAGFDGTYLRGRFNGNEFILAPQYDQWMAGATIKYSGGDISVLDASAGYTRRTPKDVRSVQGLTGSIGYHYRFSDFTNAELKVSRNVNTYLSFLGSEIDTTASVGVGWAPTAKISVTPSYQWLYSTFPQVATAEEIGGIEIERKDHYQLLALTIKYQLLNWLSISPFGQYDTRRSNVDLVSFDRSIYGISFEVKLSGQGDQPNELTLPD